MSQRPKHENPNLEAREKGGPSTGSWENSRGLAQAWNRAQGTAEDKHFPCWNITLPLSFHKHRGSLPVPVTQTPEKPLQQPWSAAAAKLATASAEGRTRPRHCLRHLGSVCSTRGPHSLSPRHDAGWMGSWTARAQPPTLFLFQMRSDLQVQRSGTAPRLSRAWQGSTATRPSSAHPKEDGQELLRHRPGFYPQRGAGVGTAGLQLCEWQQVTGATKSFKITLHDGPTIPLPLPYHIFSPSCFS